MNALWLLVAVAGVVQAGSMNPAQGARSASARAGDTSAQELDAVIAHKSEIAQKLVKKAVAFIKEKGITVACADLRADAAWQEEEVRPWVCDIQGEMLVCGDNDEIVWRMIASQEPQQNNPLPLVLQAAKGNGGFCNFLWNNSYCRSFVQMVDIQGHKYIVGANLYPASPIYIIDELITAAMNYLGSSNIKDLCERINNPTGSLVRGDIHLSVFDMKGTCLADGEQIAFVGQNLLDATTGDGKFLLRDCLAIARTKGQGWYRFQGINSNAAAEMFVKKVVDPVDRQEYMITAGYYPDVDHNTVITVVKNAVNYLKAHGREIAFRDFTSQPERFAHGNVHVFVYDMSGKMMADSANPAFVGLNLIGSRDAQGRFITRQILDTAHKYGRGWVTNNLRNTYQVSYVEKVKAPDGDFVIGAAYFPIIKESTVEFMVKDAELLMQNERSYKVFQRFSRFDIDFLKGDLSMSVYTSDGMCLADGLNRRSLWRSAKELKDDTGKPMFEEMLAYAKSGGGWLSFTRNKGTYRLYVKGLRMKGLQTDDDLFILCSGYYA